MQARLFRLLLIGMATSGLVSQILFADCFLTHAEVIRYEHSQPNAHPRGKQTKTGKGDDLFVGPPVYKPRPAKKTISNSLPRRPPLPLLRFEWRILKCGASGTDTEVSPDTIFHTDDLWKLSVRTNQNGYLYVINQTEGLTGSIISAPKQIFPDSNIDNGRNDVSQKDVKILPSGCRPQPEPCYCRWRFDSTAGREVIIIVFTREPLDLNDYRSGDKISPTYTAQLKSEWERMKIAAQIKSISNPDIKRQQNGDAGPHARWVTNYNLKSNEKLIWFIYLSNAGKTARQRDSSNSGSW